jgi:hypothetical protein
MRVILRLGLAAVALVQAVAGASNKFCSGVGALYMSHVKKMTDIPLGFLRDGHVGRWEEGVVYVRRKVASGPHSHLTDTLQSQHALDQVGWMSM